MQKQEKNWAHSILSPSKSGKLRARVCQARSKTHHPLIQPLNQLRFYTHPARFMPRSFGGLKLLASTPAVVPSQRQHAVPQATTESLNILTIQILKFVPFFFNWTPVPYSLKNQSVCFRANKSKQMIFWSVDDYAHNNSADELEASLVMVGFHGRKDTVVRLWTNKEYMEQAIVIISYVFFALATVCFPVLPVFFMWMFS